MGAEEEMLELARDFARKVREYNVDAFDEWADLTEDNPDRGIIIARKLNMVFIDDWGERAYVLIFPRSDRAVEVFERALRISDLFDRVDFPLDFFVEYFGREAEEVLRL